MQVHGEKVQHGVERGDGERDGEERDGGERDGGANGGDHCGVRGGHEGVFSQRERRGYGRGPN